MIMSASMQLAGSRGVASEGFTVYRRVLFVLLLSMSV